MSAIADGPIACATRARRPANSACVKYCTRFARPACVCAGVALAKEIPTAATRTLVDERSITPSGERGSRGRMPLSQSGERPNEELADYCAYYGHRQSPYEQLTEKPGCGGAVGHGCN